MLCSGLLRDSDRFGRIGGDEFVILLYGTGEKETEAFFNRVAQSDFEVNVDGNKVVPIGFSAGWVGRKASWAGLGDSLEGL